MRLFELSNNVDKMSKKLDEEAVLNLLKGDYKNAYHAARAVPIYTKLISEKPFLIVNPDRGSRGSKFIIDELISEFTSWSGIAERQHSNRGYTDFDTASNRGEGQVYIMLVKDHRKVTAAPKNNFYRSFSLANNLCSVKTLDNSALQSWLTNLYKARKKLKLGDESAPEIETAGDFVKALDQLKDLRGKVLDELVETGIDELIIRQTKAQGKFASAREYFNHVLSPEENDFKTYSSAYNLKDEQEIWTDAPCLCISHEHYQDMYARKVVK